MFVQAKEALAALLSAGRIQGGVFGVWRPPLHNTLGKQKE